MQKIIFTNSFISRLLFLIAVITGGIGAFGQAFLLYHELVECYPYKMMSFPSANHYKNIAEIGIYLAPIIAIGVGVFCTSKIWKIPIVSVVLCPLLFVCIFKMTFILRGWNEIVETGRNFDGTTAESVAQAFFISAVSLSIGGLVVGAVCGLILLKLDSINKLS